MRVAVVGAGLSGCSAAYYLARAGCRVFVLDRHSAAAQEASGNPVGVFMPYLSSRVTAMWSAYKQGYDWTLKTLADLDGGQDNPWLMPTGVVHVPKHQRMRRLVAENRLSGWNASVARVLDAHALSDLASTSIPEPGLYYQSGACINMPGFCHAFLREAGDRVSLQTGFRLRALSQRADHWVVMGDGQGLHVDAVVLAQSWHHRDLGQTSWIPTRRLRGQIVFVRSQAAGFDPKTAICGDGYLTPVYRGDHIVGATFDRGVDHVDLDPGQNRVLLENLSTWLPQFPWSAADCSRGRVAYRNVSPDRIPIVGSVPDMPQLLRDGAHGIANFDQSRVPLLAGLFVSLGHSSRGTSTCPIAGALIAKLVTGTELGDLDAFARLTTPIRFARKVMIESATGQAKYLRS